MSEAKEAIEAAPKPAGARKGVLLIVAAVVVLGAAGGGGWWWYSRGKHAEGASTATAAPVEQASGVVPLEAFLVNLADPGASRYMRTTLKLVVPDEKTAEKLTKNEVAVTRARSAILELLTTKTSTELVTADGKTALKQAICERVSPVFGVQVSDVLFADFVVQF